MHSWKTTLHNLFIPGGILLAVVAGLVHANWLIITPPAASFLYWCFLIAGLLLAWRFRSSRVLSALVVLFLAYQGVSLYDGMRAVPGTPGWTVLISAAVLVPVNFVLIGLAEERGVTAPATAVTGMFLFVQLVIVAVLAHVGEMHPIHTRHAISMPGYVWAAAGVAELILLLRCWFTRRPPDAAFFWSLGALLLSLHFVASPRVSAAYAATALAILASSVVETSYLLAYQDELTGLPSRRAFNDAMSRLTDPFTIAAVDIDHFKKFNDTYGHDTGDQVLRLVAGRLALVSGGGKAYRCGGEEFVVLFPGRTVPEVSDHLEQLRKAIKSTEFRLRGGDRRKAPRGPDRRATRGRNSSRKGDVIRQPRDNGPASSLSVTVSIGVAGSSQQKAVAQGILEAADKALYRAKANGRDRVEVDVAAKARRRARARTSGAA